ncbi:hypothetical protein SLEP1_g41927 [Rubroshorea leprosula]|uniref:Uncharacterized protein n=1 Tax=Rubroshorea leprosula TaxID=152421 RepID=A0AAV5L8J5_9ROSI|nr:hypothetical protein SLEP1_g41927 [Rubroshorea leprosula]
MASQQLKRNSETEEEKKSSTLEGLPLESSPHVKYEDIEDYRLNAYGTQAHLPVRTGQRGGGTDAPTLSGSHLTKGKHKRRGASGPLQVPRSPEPHFLGNAERSGIRVFFGMIRVVFGE